MSDASERLRFSEGIMERLRAAHEGKSHEELLELVCQLTKTYVLEQTIPYDVPLPERAERVEADDPPHAPEAQGHDSEVEPSHRTFARLVQGLQRRTALPQLDGFSVREDGRAVLVVDNQRVTFGERVTVEFVPRRTAAAPERSDAEPAPPSSRPPAPEAGAPRRAPRRAPGAPAEASPAPEERPPAPTPAPDEPAAESPPEEELDDVDHVVERFRGLELD